MQQDSEKAKKSKGKNASIGILIAVIVAGAAFGAYRGLQQTQGSGGTQSSETPAAETKTIDQSSQKATGQTTTGQAEEKSADKAPATSADEAKAKTETQPTVLPAQAEPNATFAPGQEDFELYCISCHEDGGIGGVAPKINGTTWTVEQIEERIDKGTNKMPALGLSLDAAQRKAVAQYLKTLK